MTLIDHREEDEDIFPEPPIFETDDVLPPDLIRRRGSEEGRSQKKAKQPRAYKQGKI